MEIGLIPTHMLLDELENRFDTVVFAALANLDEQSEKEVTRFKGHYRTAQGLCMNMIMRMHVIPGTQTMTNEDM